LLYNFAFLGTSEKKSREEYMASRERKLKPLTRHPQVDHSICILCGSCIRACPETHGDDSPLGIVEGRLLLINPLKCIGHGQCEIQCPTGAMSVNLGELADDPNMPILTEENESVIPGIFIAGELSGVPLVKPRNIPKPMTSLSWVSVHPGCQQPLRHMNKNFATLP
jgi:NAD-dependent dihydropyrimidine dehydrogenase PreA subunit